jgi:hypothetical protein
MHEPLMIAPERLVVPCVSDCCSSSSFVDEVNVLAALLMSLLGAVSSVAAEESAAPASLHQKLGLVGSPW